MPASSRRGHLVPEEEWEERKEEERRQRIERFSSRASHMPAPPSSGADLQDDTDFEPIFHDRHSAADARARLVESLNSRR